MRRKDNSIYNCSFSYSRTFEQKRTARMRASRNNDTSEGEEEDDDDEDEDVVCVFDT